MSVDIMMQLWEGAACLREAFKYTDKIKDENSENVCSAFKCVEKGELSKLWSVSQANEKNPLYWKDIQLNYIDLKDKTYFKSPDWSLCKTIATQKGCKTSCDLQLSELFPRIFIPPTFNMFFNKASNSIDKHNVLWTTFMFFDEKCVRYGKDNKEIAEKGASFFRTMRDLGTLQGHLDDMFFLLMYRLPEYEEIDTEDEPCIFKPGDPKKQEHNRIADLSGFMRKTDEPNYVLVRSQFVESQLPEDGKNVGAIYCGDIWDHPEIQKRAANIRSKLRTEFNSIEHVEFMAYESFVDIYLQFKNGDSNAIAKIDKIRKLNKIVKSELYVNLSEIEKREGLLGAIDKIIIQLKGRIDEADWKKLKSLRAEIANYFIWLSCISDSVKTYFVRHVNDFRFQGTDGQNYRQAFRPSGIVIATTCNFPDKSIAAKADLLINTLLAPLNDYYAIQNLGAAQVAMYARGAAHTLKNAIAIPVLRKSIISTAIKRFIGGIDYGGKYLMENSGIANLKTEANAIEKAYNTASELIVDVDFLRRQAEMMFWIMDPSRMLQDISQSDEDGKISFKKLLPIIQRAFSAGIGKLDYSQLQLSTSSDKSILQSKILTCAYNDNISEVLSGLFNGRLTIDIDIEEAKLNPLDYLIFENVLFELITNAVARTLEVDDAVFGLSIKVLSDNEMSLTITNSALTKNAIKLCENWGKAMVYEDAGSRGVSGIHQIQLLVSRCSKNNIHSNLKLIEPYYTEKPHSGISLVTTGIRVKKES